VGEGEGCVDMGVWVGERVRGALVGGTGAGRRWAEAMPFFPRAEQD
jgi:hypothetical protein